MRPQRAGRARTVLRMRERTGSQVRIAGQVALGSVLAFAGVSHLTFARNDFRAQVPTWVPLNTDFVVLASGVVEIALGGALLATWMQPRRALVGVVAATFFVAVFPGNIAQFTGHRNAFGLDSDAKRFVRLLDSSRHSWPGPSAPPTHGVSSSPPTGLARFAADAGRSGTAMIRAMTHRSGFSGADQVTTLEPCSSGAKPSAPPSVAGLMFSPRPRAENVGVCAEHGRPPLTT